MHNLSHHSGFHTMLNYTMVYYTATPYRHLARWETLVHPAFKATIFASHLPFLNSHPSHERPNFATTLIPEPHIIPLHNPTSTCIPLDLSFTLILGTPPSPLILAKAQVQVLHHASVLLREAWSDPLINELPPLNNRDPNICERMLRINCVYNGNSIAPEDSRTVSVVSTGPSISPFLQPRSFQQDPMGFMPAFSQYTQGLLCSSFSGHSCFLVQDFDILLKNGTT